MCTFFQVRVFYIILLINVNCFYNFRNELDGLTEEDDHYQERFTITLNVFVLDQERKPSQPAPWFTDQTKKSLETLFGSQIEKDETVDNFGK